MFLSADENASMVWLFFKASFMYSDMYRFLQNFVNVFVYCTYLTSWNTIYESLQTITPKTLVHVLESRYAAQWIKKFFVSVIILMHHM